MMKSIDDLNSSTMKKTKTFKDELLSMKLGEEKSYSRQLKTNTAIRVIVCEINKQLNEFRFITFISKDKKSTHIRLVKNEVK